jgi:hypothetical protein
MPENLPYWSPSLQKRWVSWWAVRPDFPNVSIPRYMDMPEIDVYQINKVPDPEVPEGFELEWGQFPEQGEDGLWYESYRFVPIQETTEE